MAEVVEMWRSFTIFEFSDETITTAMFSLIDLPFPLSALEPVISAQTLSFHHGKHLQAYVDNLNKLIPGTEFESMSLEGIVAKSTGAIFNNAGQILNHNLYFTQFRAPREANAPTGALKGQIERQFGSFETFKTGCSEAICRGAVSCAEWLERFDAGTTPGDWMDYYDAFSRHLTAHDRIHLSFARNATDVAHRHYRPVVPEPLPRFRTVLSLFGKPVLTVRRDWLSGGIYRRSLRLFGHWTLLEKRSNLFKTM